MQPRRGDPDVAVKVLRLGSARTRGEGVRLGTVRRPPRGVPKSQFCHRSILKQLLAERGAEIG